MAEYLDDMYFTLFRDTGLDKQTIKEMNEAFAEMACSFFNFYLWKERLDEFLSAYCSRIHISESELKLTRAVAAISSVIRVLHTEQDEKTIMLLCGDILNESRG